LTERNPSGELLPGHDRKSAVKGFHASLIDELYSSEPIETWQAIIGPNLHYHSGYFQGDEDLETGLQQTVRNFFPYIPPGSRILDVGCGWGGPARMLADELASDLTGVTISRTQAEWCRHKGIAVQIMDIEAELPDGHYDIAFCLEAMEHVIDKPGLLSRLYQRADRLILSVNCIADATKQPRRSFGHSMVFCTPEELQTWVDKAGWSIRHIANRRFQALRTIVLWGRNFDNVFGSKETRGQLQLLRDLVRTALKSPVAWCQSHPIIDIIAD
jgi:cyclopropane fatty-acyl-phospholipid synthase-like methyltransferase